MSPASRRTFREARHALGVNYRSKASVVPDVPDVFSQDGQWLHGRRMASRPKGTRGGLFGRDADARIRGRGDKGEDREAETDGCPLSGTGHLGSDAFDVITPFGRTRAARRAPALPRRSLRAEEIRDLLSLVALDAEFGGAGLVRVAALPEYRVSRKDALIVIEWSRSQRITIFKALEQATEIPGLLEDGREGLARFGTPTQGHGRETSP